MKPVAESSPYPSDSRRLAHAAIRAMEPASHPRPAGPVSGTTVDAVLVPWRVGGGRGWAVGQVAA